MSIFQRRSTADQLTKARADLAATESALAAATAEHAASIGADDFNLDRTVALKTKAEQTEARCGMLRVHTEKLEIKQAAEDAEMHKRQMLAAIDGKFAELIEKRNATADRCVAAIVELSAAAQQLRRDAIVINEVMNQTGLSELPVYSNLNSDRFGELALSCVAPSSTVLLHFRAKRPVQDREVMDRIRSVSPDRVAGFARREREYGKEFLAALRDAILKPKPEPESDEAEADTANPEFDTTETEAAA